MKKIKNKISLIVNWIKNLYRIYTSIRDLSLFNKKKRRKIYCKDIRLIICILKIIIKGLKMNNLIGYSFKRRIYNINKKKIKNNYFLMHAVILIKLYIIRNKNINHYIILRVKIMIKIYKK